MPATTADLMQKFVYLHDELDRGESENELRKEQLKVLEAELLGRLERANTTSQGILGRTVYIQRQLWAKNLFDSPRTVAALKLSGLTDLVEEKHNSQRLSAYVRELAVAHTKEKDLKLPLSCEQIKELLPAPLKEAIDVTEKISLRVRKK